MLPRWIKHLSLAAFLMGLALTIAAPVLLYALASATTDAELDQEQMDQTIRAWGRQFAWIMPAGMGLLFSGGIGLLFVWVTGLAQPPETRPPETRPSDTHPPDAE